MNLDALASGQSSRETQASSPSDVSLFWDIEQATMPFSVYAAMLGSQLIVTVAGRVPEFDVGPSGRESAVGLTRHGEIRSGQAHQGLVELYGARKDEPVLASPAQAELRHVIRKKPAPPSIKARPMPVRPETLAPIPLERRVAII
jgi:hypothetical protein